MIPISDHIDESPEKQGIVFEQIDIMLRELGIDPDSIVADEEDDD